MIELVEWVCKSIEHGESCDTTFYTSAPYSPPPYCTECGSNKTITCLGEKFFVEEE